MLPQVIKDIVIRKKIGLARIPLDRFHVRVARTVEEYEHAFRLVQVGYIFQGIEPLGERHMRMTEQHVLPEATVLVAYEGSQCVGTITVTQDSPAQLPLDHDYPGKLAALRLEAPRLAEIGSFSIVRRCWGSGLAHVLSMSAMRVAWRAMDATHVVIGVHPKTEAMYRAIYAFRRFGTPKEHADLRAPVLGLVVDRERQQRHMKRAFSSPMRSGAFVAEHVAGGPPLPCARDIDVLPQVDRARTKMPRDVFQELFLNRSNRVVSLSAATMSHLRRRRTDETIGLSQDENGQGLEPSVA